MLTIGFIKGLNSSILDAWELKDDALYLFEFDAEAANLHLSVLASHKLDVTVGEIAHDVSSAVDVGIFRGER